MPATGSKRSWAALIVTVIAVALAAGWSLVTRRTVSTAITIENQGYLDRAVAVFDLLRSEIQANLRAQSRVLAEDPRLKSTLQVEGMDEATIADILGDLNKLRRTGFVLILSPEGRVLAQAGAPELAGLDLASSSVVKKAQSTPDSTVGSWVIAGKVLDLAIVGIQYDTQLIAYLVVGRTLNQELITAVSKGTGVGVAVAMGDRVSLASDDAALKPVFDGVAKDATTRSSDIVAHDGANYLVSTIELEETAQAHPRLILVRSLASTAQTFDVVGWLLFVPLAIVLTACLVLMALLSNRAGGKK